MRVCNWKITISTSFFCECREREEETQKYLAFHISLLISLKTVTKRIEFLTIFLRIKKLANLSFIPSLPQLLLTPSTNSKVQSSRNFRWNTRVKFVRFFKSLSWLNINHMEITLGHNVYMYSIYIQCLLADWATFNSVWHLKVSRNNNSNNNCELRMTPEEKYAKRDAEKANKK